MLDHIKACAQERSLYLRPYTIGYASDIRITSRRQIRSYVFCIFPISDIDHYTRNPIGFKKFLQIAITTTNIDHGR